MKDLINRYVYDVTRRLPVDTREEVAKELNANIADMLPENPTPEDIKNVLVGLGEPRELAAGYRGTGRYLISPKWMDEYIRVLKIVIVVFASITLVFGLIDHILHPEATTVIGIIAEVFARVLSEIIESAFRAFALVTIVFAGIDFYGAKCKKEPWNPESLPQLPKENVNRISRTETIVGLILTAIFGTLGIYFLWNNQLYIGWYDGEDFGTLLYPLFTDAVVRTFLPLFVISLGLELLNHAWKLKIGHWNVPVAIIHTVQHVFGIALFIAFVKQPDLINATFLAEAAAYFETNAAALAEGITNAATGFATFLGFVSVIDLIATWVKALKRPAAKRA